MVVGTGKLRTSLDEIGKVVNTNRCGGAKPPNTRFVIFGADSGADSKWGQRRGTM